jgi:UDP-glucose:(heptosyl)LPS alpha-1,3-glucosyltransferase
MKICFVAGEINKQGGISRYVAELAERYVRKYETHAITTNCAYKIPDLIVHKKPDIQKPLWRRRLYNIYYNNKYSKQIKKSFDIDIIHLNGGEALFCDVYTMHSCHKAWIKHYKSWGILQNIRASINISDRIALPIEKKLINEGSKKIISVSQRIKKEILENYDVREEKITVIPNGVDLDEFNPDAEKREEIRNKFGIEENDIVLMFSGREFERKGLEYIIKALPEVDKNVKLFVVGKSDPKHAIELPFRFDFQSLANKLGVSDSIIFTGFVPEIKDYYAASDIFVFPTAYEPFGLVITEAMASGLPVITSKSAGAAELIRDGHDGLLLDEPNNVNKIAEKIKFLIENESIRRQIGRNARKTAKDYSWDEIAKRTMEVYEEVAKR